MKLLVSSRKGFTLIELLVVIAIIAILAAILFPVFAQARGKARAISALSNIKQSSLAVNMYLQDYDETFPVSDIWTFGGGGWISRVAPYVKNIQIYQSVADSGAKGELIWDTTPGVLNPGAKVSIAANSLMGTGTGGAVWPENVTRGVITPWNDDWFKAGWYKNSAVSLASVQRSADSIMLGEHYADTIGTGGGNGASWMQFTANFYPGNMYLWDDWTGSNYYSTVYGSIPDGVRADTFKFPEGKAGAAPDRHNGQTNFAFVDGHAKSLKAVNTNPDGKNHPENNMWDGMRN